MPPGVVALLGAAFVARVANKWPPLWERLIGGLKFYSTPYESDVARLLTAAMEAKLVPVSLGGSSRYLSMALQNSINHYNNSD